ncbi:MAG: hypothetical protein IJX01_02715, partial [Oscillospiraceae bacterium]|nr:hypothetical protein [Oscillospiraceae bacterium]
KQGTILSIVPCSLFMHTNRALLKIHFRPVVRDFGADQVLETAGILCVFQGFQKEELRRKIRQQGGKGFLAVTAKN